jgi:hypothetical protein
VKWDCWWSSGTGTTTRVRAYEAVIDSAHSPRMRPTRPLSLPFLGYTGPVCRRRAAANAAFLAPLAASYQARPALAAAASSGSRHRPPRALFAGPSSSSASAAASSSPKRQQQQQQQQQQQRGRRPQQQQQQPQRGRGMESDGEAAGAGGSPPPPAAFPKGPHVRLRSGKARLFLEGNPLVYGEAVDGAVGGVGEGDFVEVVDCKGNLIGKGVYNPHSMYRVRLLWHAREKAEQAHADTLGGWVVGGWVGFGGWVGWGVLVCWFCYARTLT